MYPHSREAAGHSMSMRPLPPRKSVAVMRRGTQVASISAKTWARNNVNEPSTLLHLQEGMQIPAGSSSAVI